MSLKVRLQEAVRQAQEFLELERLCQEAAERAAPVLKRLDLKGASDDEVARTLEPLGEPQR